MPRFLRRLSLSAAGLLIGEAIGSANARGAKKKSKQGLRGVTSGAKPAARVAPAGLQPRGGNPPPVVGAPVASAKPGKLRSDLLSKNNLPQGGGGQNLNSNYLPPSNFPPSQIFQQNQMIPHPQKNDQIDLRAYEQLLGPKLLKPVLDNGALRPKRFPLEEALHFSLTTSASPKLQPRAKGVALVFGAHWHEASCDASQLLGAWYSDQQQRSLKKAQEALETSSQSQGLPPVESYLKNDAGLEIVYVGVDRLEGGEDVDANHLSDDEDEGRTTSLAVEEGRYMSYVATKLPYLALESRGDGSWDARAYRRRLAQMFAVQPEHLPRVVVLDAGAAEVAGIGQRVEDSLEKIGNMRSKKSLPEAVQLVDAVLTNILPWLKKTPPPLPAAAPLLPAAGGPPPAAAPLPAAPAGHPLQTVYGVGSLLIKEGVTVVSESSGYDVPQESTVLEKAVALAVPIAERAAVGFYFSAHWCGPCRNFTPKLAGWYERHTAFMSQQTPEFQRENRLEIVFVSSDHSAKDFNEYYSENMPWCAIPFGQENLRDALNEKFGVQGIPDLQIVDAATGKRLRKIQGRSIPNIADETGTKRALPWSRSALAPAPASAPAGRNRIERFFLFSTGPR